MAKQRVAPRAILAPAAQMDARDLLRVNELHFGKLAKKRYKALLQQALLDIGADPKRPGSQARPEIMIDGLRTYHISFSRRRVIGPQVKDPRHFLLYRRLEDGVIEVARIFHDSRDLQLHLPEDYRQQNPDG